MRRDCTTGQKTTVAAYKGMSFQTGLRLLERLAWQEARERDDVGLVSVYQLPLGCIALQSKPECPDVVDSYTCLGSYTLEMDCHGLERPPDE